MLCVVNPLPVRRTEVIERLVPLLEQTPADVDVNFHGGELVINYPFDSNPESEPVFSPAPDPDHDFYYSISRTYADNNPPMSTSNGAPSFDD